MSDAPATDTNTNGVEPPESGDSAESPAAIDDELTLQGLDEGLAELVERLGQLEQQSSAYVDQRVDGLAGEVAEALAGVAGQVLQLRTDVDTLLVTAAAPVVPTFWVDRATAADWTQLIEWVDELQTRYAWVEELRIYPCWPAHPGVAEELAGLYHSWRQAQLVDEQTAKPGSDKKRGSSDLTAWHDRWLWPFLNRVRAGHFRIISCQRGHEEPVLSPTLTDRAFLPGSRPRTGRDAPAHSVTTNAGLGTSAGLPGPHQPSDVPSNGQPWPDPDGADQHPPFTENDPPRQWRRWDQLDR